MVGSGVASVTGVAIGSSIIGGTPHEILYIDDSTQLFSDAEMTRDPVTHDTLVLKSDATYSTGFAAGNIGFGADVGAVLRIDNVTADAPAVFIMAADGAAFGLGPVVGVMDYADNTGANASSRFDSTAYTAHYFSAAGTKSFLSNNSTGAFIGYTDNATFNRFFYSDANDIGWQDTNAGYKFKLPQSDGTSGQAIITDGFADLSFGTPSVGIGSTVLSGTPHEVLYVNASGNLDSDAAFTRNMTTNVSAISNTAGGITVFTSQDPTIGVYSTWTNGTTTSATILDQRGLQVRGSTNEVTLESFVIKQASGLKILEQKNSGLFFVSNTTVTASLPFFVGGGLDDITVEPLTTYSSLLQSVTYTITIDSTGTPDTFTWTDGTTTVNNVPITGAPQTLSNNAGISFAATTGHTLSDSWTFSVAYSIGKTIYANGNITSIEVSIGDYDGMFNRTVLAVKDSTQTIEGRTGLNPTPDQLLFVSGVSDYVALGFQTGTASTGTYIGSFAGFGLTGANSSNVAVGAYALVTGSFPPPLPISGVRNTAVGTVSGFGNNGDDNCYLGYETRMIGGSFDHSVAIGREAYINATGQMAFGSGLVLYAVNDFVFGGQERSVAGAVVLRTSSGEVASNADGTDMTIRAGDGGGTDTSGGNLTLSVGRHTGASTGISTQGQFNITSSLPGSTGSTLQTEHSWFRLEALDASILIGDAEAVFSGGSLYINPDDSGAGGVKVFNTTFQQCQSTDVTASNTITLPEDGNLIKITGNTQINNISTSNVQAGTEFILWFTGTPLVKHNNGGGGSILFAGSVDFNAANNSVVKIFFDGTDYQELSRKVA